jgi:DNA-binding MarR family transcriptional regulator
VGSPQSREALLEEIAELYAIVLRISRRIATDDAPMTATQRLALMEVAAAGPLRIGTLASRMDTTPATATRAIDFLERAAFVGRKPDPDDGRAVWVFTTAKGRRWSTARRAHLLEVLRHLPADSIPARLVGDLAKLNEALRVTTGHDEGSRGALLAP